MLASTLVLMRFEKAPLLLVEGDSRKCVNRSFNRFREVYEGKAYNTTIFVLAVLKKLAQNIGISYCTFGKTAKSKTYKEIMDKMLVHRKNRLLNIKLCQRDILLKLCNSMAIIRIWPLAVRARPNI